MRHIFARQMYATNTGDGIRRYLSGLGFDVGREIKYEDGPTKALVVAVQEAPKVTIKDRKNVIKSRAKKLKK
jgi:hypothetical protein